MSSKLVVPKDQQPVKLSTLCEGEVFVQNATDDPNYGFRVVRAGTSPKVQGLAPTAPKSDLPMKGNLMVYPASLEITTQVRVDPWTTSPLFKSQ